MVAHTAEESLQLLQHVLHTVKLLELYPVTEHIPHLLLHVQRDRLQHVGQKGQLVQVVEQTLHLLVGPFLGVVHKVAQESVERQEVIGDIRPQVGLHEHAVQSVGQAPVMLLYGAHQIAHLRGVGAHLCRRAHQPVALLHHLLEVWVGKQGLQDGRVLVGRHILQVERVWGGQIPYMLIPLC